MLSSTTNYACAAYLEGTMIRQSRSNSLSATWREQILVGAAAHTFKLVSSHVESTRRQPQGPI